MKAGGLGIALVAVLLGVGCGGGETETVVERQTVVEKAPEPAAPAPEKTEAEPSPSSPEPEVEAGAGAGDITVPNVIGKDHQLAQDTMQAAGLYNLREEDATGQGRALLIDRNWTTVKQSPAAGTKVSEDSKILLSAQKDGE